MSTPLLTGQFSPDVIRRARSVLALGIEAVNAPCDPMLAHRRLVSGPCVKHLLTDFEPPPTRRPRKPRIEKPRKARQPKRRPLQDRMLANLLCAPGGMRAAELFIAAGAYTGSTSANRAIGELVKAGLVRRVTKGHYLAVR